MSEQRVFILGGTFAEAAAWCKDNDARPYARTTIIARREERIRGHQIRSGDQVVWLHRTYELLQAVAIAQLGTDEGPA